MSATSYRYECKVRRENDDETRYLDVEINPENAPFGIENLQQEILKLFAEPEGSVIKRLRYRDSDGDMITVSENEGIAQIHKRVHRSRVNVELPTNMFYSFLVERGPISKSTRPRKSGKVAPRLHIVKGSNPKPKLNSERKPGESIDGEWEIENNGTAPCPEKVGMVLQYRKNAPEGGWQIALSPEPNMIGDMLPVPELSGMTPGSHMTIRAGLEFLDSAELGKKHHAFLKFVDLDTGHYIYGSAIKILLKAA